MLYESHAFLYNLTKRDVTLSDIEITIPAMGCVNLWHTPNLTDEKLQKSIESGSISKRGGYVKLGGKPQKFSVDNQYALDHMDAKGKVDLEHPGTVRVSQMPLELRHKGGFKVIPEKFTDASIDEFANDLDHVENMLNQEDDLLWNPKAKK